MLIPLLLLSGPPGVGKTTIAWKVFDQAVASGMRPALIDIDLLGAYWPAPDDDPYNDRLKAANITAVWENFAAAGAQGLIAAGVVGTPAIRDLYAGAVPHSSCTLCRLQASNDELASRIVRRGRETDTEVDRLTRRSHELARQLELGDFADLIVSTSGRDPNQVAKLIRELLNGLPTT